MKFLYQISVRSYSFAVRIASLWNTKAKKWMKGREQVWDDLANWERKDTPVYWFHCASLGEFEQGRPIMESLKEKEDCQLVVTFFSPSGYEIRKDYEQADLVVYLPRETKQNVRKFLNYIEPKNVFFIKYEFWATYIFEAKKSGASVFSVSAVFRKKQLFFKTYGGYMRSVLRAFDHIFVQDQKSLDLLKTISIPSTLAGDTRYDRVAQNARRVKPYPEIEAFIAEDNVLVIGSSWEPDERILEALLNASEFNWKVIIAPHEIDESHLKTIESRFNKPAIRYSDLIKDENKNSAILVIDNIGMLMNVYQYANLAYVGGAFGKGLHNILEPACFGAPVIFGNNFEKFIEAFDFIDHGIGFSISSSDELITIFKKLSDQDISLKVQQFMADRQGATAKINSIIKASL